MQGEIGFRDSDSVVRRARLRSPLPSSQWAAGQFELSASPTAASRAKLAASQSEGGGNGGAWSGVVWAAGKEGEEEEEEGEGEEEAEAEDRG